MITLKRLEEIDRTADETKALVTAARRSVPGFRVSQDAETTWLHFEGENFRVASINLRTIAGGRPDLVTKIIDEWEQLLSEHMRERAGEQ